MTRPTPRPLAPSRGEAQSEPYKLFEAGTGPLGEWLGGEGCGTFDPS
jgi:hypothetical protein